MSLPPESHQVLLTSSDIKRLEDERARAIAEIDAIDAKRREIEGHRDEITSRLEKIQELLVALGLSDRLSMAAPSAISPSPDAPAAGQPIAEIGDGDEGDSSNAPRSPWIGEIMRLLRSGPYESLTSSELRQAVEVGSLHNVFKVSDKGYYTPTH